MTAQGSNSRCRLCGDKTRYWRDLGRLLVCLNLCLVVAGIIYVGVLHREVATLRTELGRCSGSVGIPASQTGNSQVDVGTDEADENERIGGNGRLTESPGETVSRELLTDRKKSRENIRDDMKFRHWRAPRWARNYASMFHYDANSGRVTVREAGLYFVYSQVTTDTNALRAGYSVFIDDDARFTCIEQAPATDSTQPLVRTCSTSGVVVLRRGQYISIGVRYMGVRAIMKPHLSYWGMVQLANYSE
ncbi:hypothetical protein LSAT2_019051 [Lamellibrachia satsuma]|nr:hypothetical protein LSAT2_019051 [Lamellibrachia satsuma]